MLAVYASGSLRKALIHLFPDVGLDESKFVTYPSKSLISIIIHIN